MKISYNWLKEYLPKDDTISKLNLNPEKISHILTSVGLEVEAIEKYEEIDGRLEGLVTGEVMTCEKHEDADKLKVTKVDVGIDELLQIVCGASNVAVGQKVIVALNGAILHPISGEPFTIKKAKIRGVESNGMLCAEDEIGLGNSHAGIIVLPPETRVGLTASEYYQLYSDTIFEIGLTPNRMDAMSHLGVAKDVCAYLSHFYKVDINVEFPYKNKTLESDNSTPIQVSLPDTNLCERYAGISISGVTVAPSPKWLQNKLKSIGLKPLNNIVDITNFILHETGQPLHAFDADKIKGNQIIVQTLPKGTPFITLDDKERKLSSEDIIICNGDNEPMCIAGVFGGAESGVSQHTTSLFLESAVFNPQLIRKTMLRYNLRTEAAIRFEKGIDISNTVKVLKRAALMIHEITGGSISSEVVDVYPQQREKKKISLTNHYLKKISGKNYHPDTVKNILTKLNFTILREGIDEIQVAVPFSNPDISIPVDVIEEIMRIDGLDNIEIPSSIQMAPAVETRLEGTLKGLKVMSFLTANGFAEIFTNSITNSDYFDEETLKHTVKIINSLSVDLDVMRPSMLPTGLESIAYNINRKNSNLLFVDLGKTYSKINETYHEKENLALFFTGNRVESGWNQTSKKVDIFFVKGVVQAIFSLLGLKNFQWEGRQDSWLGNAITANVNGSEIAMMGSVQKNHLNRFSIKQEVFFLCLDWRKMIDAISEDAIAFKAIVKFPEVNRDLSLVVDKGITYQSIEDLIQSLRLKKLIGLRLFDIFESEKLGANKKSLAINFTFSDNEKTLVDKEVDNMMNKIIDILETNLNAEIRRNA
ncbi:MAG: phenylalanine--tRNA ligase subunit beta [Ginsengibacter sp.]|jgi:phenylalanyl-tRNA synthetase beta chain